MDRFIKDPTGLTVFDLQNNDWDLIKLNITVDATALMDWVNVLQTQHRDSIWTFDRFDLVDEEKMEYFVSQRDKLLVRTEESIPEQWTLQWSYQRDGVLPFKGLANRNLYPEVYQPEFDATWNQNQTKYEFGSWKRYYEALGPDVFTVARLVRFPKNCGLNTHVDVGPNQPYLIRMHTLPSIGPNHYFSCGDDPNDPTRQYKMEAGCSYLLNTGIPHRAINYDNKDWWMLHNNPLDDTITMLLNTRMHVD
jgi:hypothetical protein